MVAVCRTGERNNGVFGGCWLCELDPPRRGAEALTWDDALAGAVAQLVRARDS